MRLGLAQTISVGGDMVTEIALAVFVLNATHGSAVAWGTVLFAGFLPRVLLGWAVAPVVDRWHRGRVLIASDLLRALLVAALPWFNSARAAVAVVFFIQLVGMFYLPTARAVLPETVPKEQLLQANAWLSSAESSMRVAAYGLAAVLTLRLATTQAFWLDALSYAVSAALVAGIRLSPSAWQPNRARAAAGFWSLTRDGIRFHRRHRWVLRLLVLSGLAALATEGINVVTPVAVLQLLRRPAGTYGLLMTALEGGMLAASALISRFGNRWRPALAINTGFVAMGAAALALSGIHRLAPALLLYVAMGAANAAFLLSIRTWLQSHTPSDYRGRVYAARSLVLGAAGALAAPASGWLAQGTGAAFSLQVCGGLLALAGAVGFWWLRSATAPVASSHPEVGPLPGPEP